MQDQADIAPLLTSQDPPPVTVENPSGRAPVLLVCDHACNTVPRALDNLGLGPEELDAHIAWDPGALDVTRRVMEVLDAPAVIAGYSRAVVDVNRYPDHPTFIPEMSDTIKIPGNLNLTSAHKQQRIREIYDPYHARIARELDRFRARSQVPVVLFMHSFTPVMGQKTRPWHMGILSNEDDRVGRPLLDNLGRDPDLKVGHNLPYSGAISWDASRHEHAVRFGYPHSLVEFRQDLVRTPDGARDMADRFLRALEPVLEDETLYQTINASVLT